MDRPPIGKLPLPRITPARNATGLYRNRKATRACDACCNKKVKCDAGFPCRRCTSMKLDCHFSPDKRQIARENKTQLHNLEKRVAEYDGLFSQVQAYLAETQELDATEIQRILLPTGAPRKNGALATATPSQAFHSGMPTPLFTPKEDTSYEDLSAFVAKDNTGGWDMQPYTKDVNMIELKEALSQKVDTAWLPPKLIADMLLDQFFSSLYPIFPIINKPLFLAQVDKLYSISFVADSILGTSGAIPPSFLSLLLLTLAIGRCAASSDPLQVSKGLGQECDSYYQRALTLADAPETPKCKIREVQHWILRSVYLLSAKRFNDAKVAIDRATDLAVRSGYPSIATYVSDASDLELELKQRLWRSIGYLNWVIFRTIGGVLPVFTLKEYQHLPDATDLVAKLLSYGYPDEESHSQHKRMLLQRLFDHFDTTITTMASTSISDVSCVGVGLVEDGVLISQELDILLLHHESVLLMDVHKARTGESSRKIVSLLIGELQPDEAMLVNFDFVQSVPQPLRLYFIHTCLLALSERMLYPYIETDVDALDVPGLAFDLALLEHFKDIVQTLDLGANDKQVERYYLQFIDLILKAASNSASLS